MSNQIAKARSAFLARVALPVDSSAETFDSLLWIARLNRSLGCSLQDYRSGLLTAFEYRSIRLEPVYYLADTFREAGMYATCASLSGLQLAFPENEIGSVDGWIYQWGMQSLHALCSYFSGQFDLALMAAERTLLLSDLLPEELRGRMEAIRRESRRHLDNRSSAARLESLSNCVASLAIARLELELNFTADMVLSSLKRAEQTCRLAGATV
jgi:hypothetical protein